MHDEDPDRHRHFLLVDQFVENGGGVVLNAILVDVDAGGFIDSVIDIALHR
jgi:hypothetical protein